METNRSAIALSIFCIIPLEMNTNVSKMPTSGKFTSPIILVIFAMKYKEKIKSKLKNKPRMTRASTCKKLAIRTDAIEKTIHIGW